jgi:hypothetical protein
MKRFIGIALVLLPCTVAVAWFAARPGMYINGSLASTGVIEKNGVAYVPVKDVATALKLTMKKTARGYELADAGGANAIKGVTGKTGDVLWNGYVRFQVVQVIRGETYTNQFAGSKEVVTAYPEGNELVVLVCKLKNGMKKAAVFVLPAGPDTALTDAEGRSHSPRSALTVDCADRNPKLLPGAAVDFAITFDVPAGTELKDLVYEAQVAGDNAPSKTKFRVSLKE